MSLMILVLSELLPVLPAIGLGYIIGVSRGEDAGYKLGYHEGEFDAEMRS